MPQETLGYVKLEWTCPKCGMKNVGTQKTCTSCGAAMPEGQQFDLPAQQQLITDEKELAQTGKGPDIHCPYCGTRNRGDAVTCTQCGGKLAEGAKHEAGAVLGAYQSGPVPDVACPRCGAMNPGTALKCKQCGGSMAMEKPAPAAVTPKPAAPGGLPVPLIVGGVLLLLVICACLYFAFFRTSETQGTVRSLAWERSIAILALVPTSHSDWADQIPAGATRGACASKYRNTQDGPAPRATKVCGTRYIVDQGDGTGKVVEDCNYAVYDDWCQYTVDEWTVINTVVASGTDANPRWPAVSLAGGQREGDRNETYTITFISEDKQYQYHTSDPNAFARFTPGSRWKLKINGVGTVVGVEPAG